MLSLGRPDLARWSLSLLAEEAVSDLRNESSYSFQVPLSDNSLFDLVAAAYLSPSS